MKGNKPFHFSDFMLGYGLGWLIGTIASIMGILIAKFV
jgi:hypothetical protein